MRALAALACGVLLAACAEDAPGVDASAIEDAAMPDAGDAGDGDASSSDAEALRAARGTFGIELVAAVPESDEASAVPAYTDIVGRIYDMTMPSTQQWRMLAQEGDCELFEPHNPFCDPACTGGAVCRDGNTCAPPATALDVGSVVIRGLNDAEGPTELTLMPRAPSNLYQPGGASALVYPPFEAGDTVTLAATGGVLPAFEVRTQAIAPLEVTTEAPVPFGGDAPTVLQWVAAEASSTRIVVRVDISHHGGNKGEVVCETDDDGALELPASIVQGLIDLGVAGYPGLEIERVAINAASDEAPGIALRIFSSVSRAIAIPGIVSCNEENEADVCPEGQTCLVTRLCGEER